MTARHGNRPYRIRLATPPEAMHEMFYRRPSGDPGGGWTTRERSWLAVAGGALVLGVLIGSPVVALVSLPAGLLGPGHVALRALARRLPLERDPWLAWCLRVVLSLAVWTLLGSLFVLLPGLDPRTLPLVLGVALLLFAVGAPPAAPDDLDGDSPAENSLEPDEHHEFEDDDSPPERFPSRWRNAAVGLVFAAVAAGSTAGAYAISTATVAPEPYVSMTFTPATGPAYDPSGRAVLSAVVHNGTTEPLRGEVVVTVDGKAGGRQPITVAPGTSVSVPTTPGAKTAAAAVPCWRRLTVGLTGVPTSVAPRDLIAWGPATDPDTDLKTCTPTR